MNLDPEDRRRLDHEDLIGNIITARTYVYRKTLLGIHDKNFGSTDLCHLCQEHRLDTLEEAFKREPKEPTQFPGPESKGKTWTLKDLISWVQEDYADVSESDSTSTE